MSLRLNPHTADRVQVGESYFWVLGDPTSKRCLCLLSAPPDIRVALTAGQAVAGWRAAVMEIGADANGNSLYFIPVDQNDTLIIGEASVRFDGPATASAMTTFIDAPQHVRLHCAYQHKGWATDHRNAPEPEKKAAR